jgi:hypothetical protein
MMRALKGSFLVTSSARRGVRLGAQAVVDCVHERMLSRCSTISLTAQKGASWLNSCGHGAGQCGSLSDVLAPKLDSFGQETVVFATRPNSTSPSRFIRNALGLSSPGQVPGQCRHPGANSSYASKADDTEALLSASVRRSFGE